MMRVIVARAAGMCFGVRDALHALTTIEHPETTAIYGELVHNDVVLQQLELRGFQQMSETERDQSASAPTVVITAHGISDHRRAEFLAAGQSLIDTTCPLVTRVHRAAQELAESGAFVVVIGRKGHVEVEGIVGDLERFAVVSTAEDVVTYPSARVGVICQTTACEEAAATIRQAIEARNPQASIHWVDTICQPTKDRQAALKELLQQVQVMVVVGGRRSNNTQKLADTCRQQGLPTWHVQAADELQPQWFQGIEVVGLTAGTSTLPETMDDVRLRLEEIGKQLAACPIADFVERLRERSDTNVA